MGYTHYWYRKLEIEPQTFQQMVKDFQKLIPVLEQYGVRLGNGIGQGTPITNQEEVRFNGLEKCGHPENHDLVIPWPAKGAGGVMQPGIEGAQGAWFAGSLVETHCCNGDCSYETFSFPRVIEKEEWSEPDEKGRYFSCTKTAYRPYDLAVTAFLVIAKHYLGKDIRVVSDGEEEHWYDAKFLCQMELGYGMEFSLPVSQKR